MALPVVIILLIVCCYSLLILLLYIEMDKDTGITPGFTEQPRPVSLIIPFRNEADNLPSIFKDLLAQSYPMDLLEVIFVDDHSDDGSASMLLSLIKSQTLKEEGFYCLELPPGRTGKKAALSIGIAKAKHEWIIQVDADCRVGPRFIVSHMSFLEKTESDLIAGVVTTGRETGSFLEIFERLDTLSLVGSGAGSFALGRPMMCSGANLAYSRKLYWETRAFDPGKETASGDDMFLMIGARKLGKTLSFIVERDSHAVTRPVRKLSDLISQRIRWGSKSTRYGMADIQLLAILVSLTNIVIMLLPVWFFVFGHWWIWLAGGWLLKTLADFMLLYQITGITNQRADLRLFIPVSLLYYPVFMVTLAGALLKKPVWRKAVR